MTARIADADAELSVLGSIIVRNTALDDVTDILEPEHFANPIHAEVFTAMRRLSRRQVAIDPVTLSAELDAMERLEQVGKPFLYRLGDGFTRSTNIAHYAKLVKEKALLRNVIAAAERVIVSAQANDATGADVLEQAEQAMFALGSTAVKSDWISGLELATELHPVLERLQAGGAVTGLETGFYELDQMTRGFQRSDLVLVGARPSQGKTAFGIAVALKAARTVPVAVFSLEMSREGIGLRGVIYEADVNGWRLLSGRASEMELRRVGEGLAALGERNIHLDESPVLTPMQVRSKLRRLTARVGQVGLVVIDYLQLMAPMPEDKRENKTNQVAGISRAMKILAREFGAPFLVLSQLHRVPDNRRPTMADLRDSGALEQDADVVLMLHRPEVYDPKPENAGLAELIIAKQRQGPTGLIELTWRGEPMRFENRARA